VKRILAAIALLAAGPAHAEDIALPNTTAKLVLADGWDAVKAAGTVVAYKSGSGSLLAVTRASVPNPDAWKADRKQAYADQVERGIKARIPGYKRSRKKLGDANGIPALDLEARRDGGATVIVRVLLFRTYALSLAIEVPKGGELTGARAIAAAFAPPKEPAKP
jgi:hypothetical protein